MNPLIARLRTSSFFSRRWLLRMFFALLFVGVAVLFGFLAFRLSPMMVIGLCAALLLALVIFGNPWHGMLLFAFSIPFERIGSYDIAGITVRPSQVIALLTILSVIFHGLGRRRFDLPRNPIVLPLLLFMIVQLLGLFHAPHLERSLMVFTFTLFTFLIAAMVPFFVRDEHALQRVLYIFFISFGLVTAFGLYQFVGDWIGLPSSLTGLRELYTKEVLGFPRVQSTALEPLYFANYLLVPLGVLLSLFLSRNRSLPPLVHIGLLGMGAAALVLTVARGGYIAFAVTGALLASYYFIERKLFSWRNAGYAFLALIIALLLVSRIANITTVYENFVGHVSNLFSGASYVERVETFSLAHSAWLTHPLVGIGPGSFGPYASAHPYAIPADGWRIVNNEYLELLAENGVLGLALMLLIFCMVIIRSMKALTRVRDPYSEAVLAGVLAGFIGILVQYNTFSILYIVHIWFTIGLLIAVQNMILYPSKQKP